MMEDQRKSIADGLVNNGYEAVVVDDGIQITVMVRDVSLKMICKLGSFFPYEIPSIYVNNEDWDLLPSIPHKYTNGSICTFDRSIVVPNINEPVQLVIATIEKAREILKDGMDGNNKVDYMDEFLAYWDTKEGKRVQSFIEDVSTCKELVWIKEKDKNIISDSIERATEVFENALGKEIEECLIGILVPTRGNETMAIPKTDLGFINLIKKNSDYWPQFCSFVQNNIDSGHFFTIVSELGKEGPMLFGWFFNGPGVPNGFRKGHVDLALAFAKLKDGGVPVKVDNCSQNRLFQRGGDGHEVRVNNAIIIGCGSVGSIAIEALLCYGTMGYTLVDNDILSVDNIARHYAGFFWVDHLKTHAIKCEMQLHNPNIICETYDENAFRFFEEHSEIINKKDLLIVAVASSPVEHYVMKKINEGAITIPVLMLWIEPYAIAGHGILINKPMDVYAELFNKDTLQYRYGVVDNPEQYNKREAGCQSTYMPYSSFTMREMIYRILEACLKDYYRTGKNYRLTWCGRLSEAKQKGVSINRYFKDKQDYSFEVERLD